VDAKTPRRNISPFHASYRELDTFIARIRLVLIGSSFGALLRPVVIGVAQERADG
jgi:hypothetical protein